jgi:hypothetical protein
MLRHQLNVLRRRVPSKPKLAVADRLLFVWLYPLFPSVLNAIAVVQPETPIRWYQTGFRLYWLWKSRAPGGRPKVPVEIFPVTPEWTEYLVATPGSRKQSSSISLPDPAPYASLDGVFGNDRTQLVCKAASLGGRRSPAFRRRRIRPASASRTSRSTANCRSYDRYPKPTPWTWPHVTMSEAAHHALAFIVQ